MGLTVEAEADEKLIDVAARAGIEINNFCGGQGLCGRCTMQVRRGRVEFFKEKAGGLLDSEELASGFVLSCQAYTQQEDLEVWIPPGSILGGDRVLSVDQILGFGSPLSVQKGPALPTNYPYRPLCRKVYLELPPPSLTDNLSDLDRISRELRKHLKSTRLEIAFNCLLGLPRVLRDNDWKVTVSVNKRDRDFAFVTDIEGGDTTKLNYGIAIDVGTTTIVAELIDLATGSILGVEASHNRQARFGEDVISRMIFACGRNGGLEPLTRAVIGTINSLIDALLRAANLTIAEITCVVAAGNTTMTHLLLGLEPCNIRIEPYIPCATRFPHLEAADLGLHVQSTASLHCLPCVSSYIGGDITAGVLACDFDQRAEVSALIDIGTNGEIVVGNKDWLVCCAASAGPAFEGGGIRCGTRAIQGAIETVSIHGRDLTFTTIGNKRPIGLCGSALIDLVAELASEGIIDQSGKFIDFEHPLVSLIENVPAFTLARSEESGTGEPIFLTEDDIANFIKSKGAILAAIKTLLDSLNMKFEDLQNVFVAGGFGVHLDIDKAIMIGLLPDIPRDRFQFVGNSSLAGARIAALSAHAFWQAEDIARRMTYLELSAHPEFMDEFVAALFLPHTQMELFPSVKEAMERRKSNDR